MSSSKLPAVFIGLRYLLAKRDNRFISFTSLVSMAGLTLGVLALVRRTAVVDRLPQGGA